MGSMPIPNNKINKFERYDLTNSIATTPPPVACKRRGGGWTSVCAWPIGAWSHCHQSLMRLLPLEFAFWHSDRNQLYSTTWYGPNRLLNDWCFWALHQGHYAILSPPSNLSPWEQWSTFNCGALLTALEFISPKHLGMSASRPETLHSK